MPSSKLKAPGKDSHQTQSNISQNITSPAPHGDHDRLVPRAGRRSGCSASSELMLGIMRKMDQNLQLLRAMDVKLIALSIHVDRLERLIAHVGESAAQVGSQVWRQQDETEELVEHLVQENQHLAAHQERQEPAARLGTLGLPQEGKELGGSWRLGFSTFCTSTPARSLLEGRNLLGLAARRP